MPELVIVFQKKEFLCIIKASKKSNKKSIKNGAPKKKAKTEIRKRRETCV